VPYLGDEGGDAWEVHDAGEGEDVDPGVGLDAAANELGYDAHHPEQVHLKLTHHYKNYNVLLLRIRQISRMRMQIRILLLLIKISPMQYRMISP
jgi:hypothetical protein